MTMPTTREQQLAEIRAKVAEWREDANRSQRLAGESRRRAEEHEAERARADEMADRWVALGRSVLLGVAPGLDGCQAPETEEVPW